MFNKVAFQKTKEKQAYWRGLASLYFYFLRNFFIYFIFNRLKFVFSFDSPMEKFLFLFVLFF